MSTMHSLRSRPGTEHGLYEVSHFGQVLTFSARGPWNDETLRRGTREMGAEIQSIDHSQPWCQLSCLYGECLMQPSVYKYFVEQTQVRRELGLSILAIVIKNSDIETTIRQQLSAAYAAANVEFEFFHDVSSAMRMLEKAGYMLNTTAISRFFDSNDFSRDQ